MGRHSGRRVLLTGGTRGIGLGIASLLAKEGARIALLGRNEAACDRIIRDLRSDGANAEFVLCELRDLDSLPESVANARELLGGIDAVCHSAGIYPEKPLNEMTTRHWAEVLDTNLTAAMVLVRESIDALSASRRGRVVHISSITGPRTGIANLSHYGASKGGLEGFVRTSAVELATRGITVNAVAPGTVLTESLEELYSDPALRSDLTSRIPIGRMGSPEDIAHAVSFLMSDEASFITGQSLIVDGGQTLPEVQ